MKDKILKVLEQHAMSDSNLTSDTAREKIASDIVKAMEPDIDYEVSAEHDIRMINQNVIPPDTKTTLIPIDSPHYDDY